MPGEADDVKPVAFWVTAWLTLVCLRSWMVTPEITSTLAGVSNGVMFRRLPVVVGTSRLSPGFDWPSPELLAVAALLGAGAPATDGPGACLAFFFADAFFLGSVEVVTSTAGSCTVSAVGAGVGGSTACA